MSTTVYTFDDAFQAKITALALRDSGFLTRTSGLVKPEYFENEADATLVKIASEYYDTYKKAPDFKLAPTLIQKALAEKKIRKDVLPALKDRLREIIVTDISDRDFVIDEVASFAKHRALENAILESVAALGRNDYNKIDDLIRKAMLVGASDDGDDYDYWAEIDNRTTKRVDLAAGVVSRDGITTGYEGLNKLLYHHGWGRKELSVIMGAAKAGKSMSLGEFGKNASLAGHNVIYFTLEVGRDIIADRIDANLSDTAIRLLEDTPHNVNAKVKAASARAGQMRFREKASGTLKSSEIRRVLEEYRARGITFDLIIVDYADIMAADRPTGDTREDSRAIYIDLRAIAFDYNAAVLTATQTNREGAKAIVAKATDVAEDFNKIRTADIVISINATPEEIKAGEARLYFAANRNGESNFSLRVAQQRDRMKFLTKILGKE